MYSSLDIHDYIQSDAVTYILNHSVYNYIFIYYTDGMLYC